MQFALKVASHKYSNILGLPLILDAWCWDVLIEFRFKCKPIHHFHVRLNEQEVSKFPTPKNLHSHRKSLWYTYFQKHIQNSERIQHICALTHGNGIWCVLLFLCGVEHISRRKSNDELTEWHYRNGGVKSWEFVLIHSAL